MKKINFENIISGIVVALFVLAFLICYGSLYMGA